MKIKIAPLGISNENFLKKIVTLLSNIFSEVELYNPIFNVEQAYSIERRQYYSTKIIEFLISTSTETEKFIQIITEYDLYIPALTFIFGEAQLKGKHSIVSICRLHEEFYTGETNEELLYERTVKETLHELGHNFGLIHCPDWDCVMHSSNVIEEIDIKSHYYCKSCIRELKRDGIMLPEYLLLNPIA